jgi:Arc/MetJ-type ribon-helix-helix transcriptional regulator
MTIHLPKELETSVLSLVQGGRFASVDDAMAEAARLLLRQQQPAKKPMTEQELHQYMMSVGLITQLPDPAQDLDDDDPEDEPVTIEGEPLSETIIRERR